MLYNLCFLICGMKIVKRTTFKNDYFYAHRDLKKAYGKATHCSNPDCTHKNPKRYEWALIKGREHSSKVDDYIQLCPSCHRRYDFNPNSVAKMVKSQTGRVNEYRMRLVMMISEEDHWIFLNITQAAKEMNINRLTISSCLNGRCKTAGGFKWRYRV